MYEVKFVRIDVGRADGVTAMLMALYLDGWRVVSHTEEDGDYTFVLEREIS